MTDADREVGALGDQVDAAVVQVEVEGHARMAAAEFGDRLAHVTHAERQRQRDTQIAAEFPVLLQHGRLRFLEVREYACAVLVKALSRVRQAQASRGSAQ